MFEREFGVLITPDYPLMKFEQQLEDLHWIFQQENGSVNKIGK